MTSSTTLLLAVLCVAAFGVISVSAGDQLEGTLTAGSAPNKVLFNLKNTGNEPLTILKWGTPLEKRFTTRMFKVYPPGVTTALAYKGRNIKRSLKRAKDSAFVTLASGEQTSAEIDLLEAYGLAKGRNRIKIDFDITVVKRDNGKITDSDIFPLSGELTIEVPSDMAAKPRKPVRTGGPAVAAAAPADSAAAPTIGAHRANSLIEAFSMNRAGARARSRAGVRAVQYQNCADKEQSIRAAVALAATQLTQSRAYLDRNCVWDERFETYFGPNTVANRAIVRGIINSVHGTINNFKIQCLADETEDADCADSAGFAYNGDPDRVVYICRNNWDILTDTHSEEGTKSGTIIHEVSHFFDTNDHEYTDTDCKKLARRDPVKAVNNADSYLFFHTLGNAIPTACAVPPALTACTGKTYLSRPLDNCEDLFRSTFDAEVKLIDTADNKKSEKEHVKTSSQGVGIYWKSYRMGGSLFGVSDALRVHIREAVHTAGRKCCIMACKTGSKLTSVQAFARAAGKTTCGVTPTA